MTTIGRLKVDGTLDIRGEINERIPAITNGLIAHFPLDGRGGTFDMIGGVQPQQNTLKGVNLFEAMNLNWRKPSSWNTSCEWDESKQAIKLIGSKAAWLNTPILVDTTKHYLITAEIFQESASPTNLLYVGGYGINSAGTRYTTYYDYNICNSWDVPLGSWQTVGTNRYGTGATNGLNGGQGGIVTGPIGWTGDAAGLCEKYYFGGLFNYNCQNTTDVIYIRNISMTITDVDNSNCTLWDDGVSVEEPTTNLYTGPSTKGMYMKSGFNGTNYGFGATTNITWTVDNTMRPFFGSGDVQKVTRINSGVSQMTYVEWSDMIALGGGYTLAANEERIISFYYFGTYGTKINPYIGGLSGNITLYSDDAWAGNGSTGLTFIVPVNQWKRITIKIKNNDATPSIISWAWCALHHNASPSIIGNNECWKFTGIQSERTKYATSLTAGSRLLGSLILPVNLSNASFTIMGRIFRQRPIDGTITSNACDLSLLGSHVCGLWYYNPAGVVSPWINADSWLQPHNHNAKTFKSGTWSWFYIQRIDNTSLRFNLLNDDGMTWTPWQVIPTTDQFFTSLRLETGTNSKYRSISFYNRVLTIDEINKNRNVQLSLSSSGNINSMKLIERSSVIPTDVYYFPLSADAKDQYKIVSPSEEVETVYKDGGVWVGGSINNLASGTMTNYTPYHSMSRIGQNFTFVMESANPYAIVLYITGLVTYTKTFLISGYMKKNGVPWIFPATLANAYNSANILKKFDSKTGYFEILEYYSDPAGTTMIMHANTQGSVVGGDVITITDFLVTEKVFPVPYTSVARGTTSLEFNLNRDISLDWSTDWSICYWKKPIGTHQNVLTGYSLESLGTSGNTVGIGYQVWGKDINSNTIFGVTGGTIIPAKYFGNWRMISLQKTGSTIVTKEWSPSEGIYTKTDTVSITTANYFNTQYGYDLKLGGFVNGSPCNAYYRDLIIAKRLMTDAELQNIYKTSMSDINGNLYVPNGINEKVIL
jgi:hypothetical protein